MKMEKEKTADATAFRQGTLRHAPSTRYRATARAPSASKASADPTCAPTTQCTSPRPCRPAALARRVAAGQKGDRPRTVPSPYPYCAPK
eukprot:scaffold23658_cov97-Isochrysis_galbana.AAC.2